MREFENYNLDKPEWYDSNEKFNIKDFNEFINTNFKLSTSTIVFSKKKR